MSTPEDPSSPAAEAPLTAPATPPAVPAGEMSKNEQNMGMLCHLAALSGYLIPFGHIVGPLVVWMIKRQEMPFVESEGKESLNFQISITIYGIAAAISILLLVGIILLPAVLVFDLVCVIIAAVQTANGKPYRYPLCIRFVK